MSAEPVIREMFEGESIQRMVEGLKLSASCAKEMIAEEPKRGWELVELGLKNMIEMTNKLLNVKGQNRQDLLRMTDRVETLSKGSR
jgi:hypothetical protein